MSFQERRPPAHAGGLRQRGGPRRARSAEGHEHRRAAPRRLALDSPSPEILGEIRDKKRFRIAPLGSGSDYTPFLQHLGIASLNIDSEARTSTVNPLPLRLVRPYTRFMDPDFSYGIALAKTGGRFVLRFTEADVLPFELRRFSDIVGRYADDILWILVVLVVFLSLA